MPSCPRCQCSVYVPSDSDRERVGCVWCGAELVTKLGVRGVDVVEVETTCETCDGTGALVTDAWSPYDGHTDRVEACPDCDHERDERDEIDDYQPVVQTLFID